jgi:cytochrome c oxidase assembly protein subunit 15
VISVPVVLAAGFAWVGALRRRPYRRDLVRLSALLPLGVVAQAVLGGFTVKGALDYGWVMGHFALSMLIVLASVLLVWRARSAARVEQADTATATASAAPQARAATATASAPATAAPEARAAGASAATALVDRTVALGARALAALGAVVLFAGTAATAAGPHAGGSPGQRINRLNFDGRGTMDFVIHRHAEIAFVFSLCAVGLWFLARRRGAPETVQRPLTILCWLLAVQGAVGLDQYETHLPTELVWVHVLLACCTWIVVLWAALSAGPLAQRSSVTEPERPAEGPLVGVAPLKFPGN